MRRVWSRSVLLAQRTAGDAAALEQRAAGDLPPGVGGAALHPLSSTHPGVLGGHLLQCSSLTLQGSKWHQARSYCSPHPPGLGFAARAQHLRPPLRPPVPRPTPCQQQQQQEQAAAQGTQESVACPACLSSCHQTAVEQARTLRPLTAAPQHSAAPSSAPPQPRLGGPSSQHPHAHPASAASLYTASWNAAPELDAPATASLAKLLSAPSLVLDITALVPRSAPTSPAPAAAPSSGVAAAQKEAAALASHVRWGAPAVAALSALAVAELLLLPTLAPGGACFGTLSAEGLFHLIRQPHDLAGLLQASQGLEWVQAFSLARKLGQVALLDTALRLVTAGKPRQVFGMRLEGAMDRQRGWAVWACHALVGLAALNLLQQGLDMTVFAGDAAAGSTWMAGGDERTLPFRCRWWLETCLAAPLLEETFFRGFLITSFAKFMPAWGAVLGSSVLFGLCHMGSVPWTSLPALTGMGCVLGYTFLRTRNLLAPLAAHCVSNTAALLAADLAAGPM